VIPAAVLGTSEYGAAKLPLRDQARSVLELLPDSWQANAIAGTLEKTSGSADDALHHLQRAVQLNPSYAYGEAMLGDLYAERGETERALEHYRQAVALNPADPDVQYRTGKLLMLAGRIPEAIPHLQVAEYGRQDAALARAIGTALVQEKQTVEGIRYLQRSVQLEPSKEALNDLGVALRTEGDLRSAAEYYRKALELDPNYSAARANLEQIEKALLPK
jgi:Flp pilus assembly protein TadD